MIESISYLGLLDDEALALDQSALELAALDHPDADLQSYADILNALVTRLASAGAGATSPNDQALILAEVIGGHYGFSGDSRTYDDPANADLIRVIDRRKGLPVTLSILYVATARRIGWQAEALNTPGHVLVRIGPESISVLIDPFNRGVIIDADHLATLLTRVLGGHATLKPDDLLPMTNRAVLVRLLLNQASRAEAAGDHERALTLMERMTTVAPAHGQGWWDRARLEMRLGDGGGARASLSAMLEITRDPAVRTHVSAALDALADR